MADAVDRLEGLEVAARDAKEAYRANRDDPALYAAHRVAAQAFAEARTEVRVAADLAARQADPGRRWNGTDWVIEDQAVTPATVAATATVKEA
jgi:hypothetical protein